MAESPFLLGHSLHISVCVSVETKPFPYSFWKHYPSVSKLLHKEVVLKIEVWCRDNLRSWWTQNEQTPLILCGVPNQSTVTKSLPPPAETMLLSQPKAILLSGHHWAMFGDHLHWPLGKGIALVFCCQTLQCTDKTNGSKENTAFSHVPSE